MLAPNNSSFFLSLILLCIPGLVQGETELHVLSWNVESDGNDPTTIGEPTERTGRLPHRGPHGSQTSKFQQVPRRRSRMPVSRNTDTLPHPQAGMTAC